MDSEGVSSESMLDESDADRACRCCAPPPPPPSAGRDRDAGGESASPAVMSMLPPPMPTAPLRPRVRRVGRGEDERAGELRVCALLLLVLLVLALWWWASGKDAERGGGGRRRVWLVWAGSFVKGSRARDP
jgi:hypothetical protein